MADDNKKKDKGGNSVILVGLALFGVVAWQVSQHASVKAGDELLPGGVRGVQQDTSAERPTTWVDVLERERRSKVEQRQPAQSGGLHH